MGGAALQKTRGAFVVSARAFDVEAGTRTCGGCGETKAASFEFFYKDSGCADDCRSLCKTCMNEKHSVWVEENRERRAEYSRKWYEDNREWHAENCRKWYAANRERMLECMKRYNEANPERKRADNHRRRAAEGSFTKEEAVALLESQEYKCEYCGADLLETSYHLDHIVPVSKGGTSYIENITAACPPCNLSKGAKDLDEWLNERAVA